MDIPKTRHLSIIFRIGVLAIGSVLLASWLLVNPPHLPKKPKLITKNGQLYVKYPDRTVPCLFNHVILDLASGTASQDADAIAILVDGRIDHPFFMKDLEEQFNEYRLILDTQNIEEFDAAIQKLESLGDSRIEEVRRVCPSAPMPLY